MEFKVQNARTFMLRSTVDIGTEWNLKDGKTWRYGYF